MSRRAQAISSKKFKGNLIDSDDEDKLIDMKMRVYKTDYVRTRRKKSYAQGERKALEQIRTS